MVNNTTKQAAPYPALLRLLDGIEGTLAVIEKRVAAISMFVILIGISITILTRVINLPIPSMGEIAIVAMAPLAFIGGAFCSYMHRHITIDAVDAFGPPRVRRAIRILAALSMMVFAGTYCWLTLSFFQYVWSSGERLIDLGTPVWIPVGCIVLGAFLMMLHASLDVLRMVLGLPRTGGME
ncbi:TRAP transporter small permease [Mariluticola halotolerans]|uniref:TRAP transporter small permease n=1 Tax=Mariluticola halotolerans TaxID=2909283 RepID=UPI0026E3F566|nr:TRAP transporter small permease [Mariluticola halotolerans]UJQ95087.1 TRAP transporter small permease [Mariluticola halotolerans]